MNSHLVSRVPFEKETPIDSLLRLSAPLGRALGDLGVGGSDIDRLLCEAVEAECILCRITVSGADLISTCLHGDTDPSAANDKLTRLRQGYCCRKGCLSNYYVVRFAPSAGIEWSEVWDWAQPGLGSPAGPAEEDVSPQTLGRKLIAEMRVQCARRPVVVGVVSLLVLVLLIIGGCRVRGLLHQSRVFIVSDAGHPPASASVHGK